MPPDTHLMTPDPNWRAKKDPAVWRRANRKYAASAHGKKVIAAKSRIRSKVRNGTLKKPSSCPRCGRSGVRIIWHHTHGHDSDKGRWCCPRCHQAIDSARSPEALSKAVKRGLAEKKKKD